MEEDDTIEEIKKEIMKEGIDEKNARILAEARLYNKDMAQEELPKVKFKGVQKENFIVSFLFKNKQQVKEIMEFFKHPEAKSKLLEGSFLHKLVSKYKGEKGWS